MGLFNRFVYGNPNKPDLEVEESPNPIKAFFEVFKIKIWDLVKLNLIFVLFMLPAVIWTVINVRVLMLPELTVVERDSVVFQYVLGLIPCILVMGIGLPSLNYITKSYAKEFHVWMFDDFIEKIKENWKQSLLYMLILGVVMFLMYFSIRAYTSVLTEMAVTPIFRGILYVMAGFLLLSTNFAYPLMVTFELKLRHLIRNSLLLTIAKLPQTLLILVITAVIPVLLIWLTMVWGYGFLVLIAYYLLFGFSLTSFIINAYTNQVFEKIIIASGTTEAEKKPEIEHDESK
jgi:uncharacterized membrane protein YesL